MRRLPNEELVKDNDIETYVNAWKSLAEPIEDATGAQLMGFDPDLLFYKKGHKSFEIPTWVAIHLNEALNKYGEILEDR